MNVPPANVVADGVRPPRPRGVFFQLSESQIGRGIRTMKWKYAVSAPGIAEWSPAAFNQPRSSVYREEYLYDLERDPHERTNLVREPGLAGVRAELGEVLKRRMKEAGEQTPEIRPAP